MGDRTYVEISIPKALLEKAITLIPDIEGEDKNEWFYPFDGHENSIEMITFGHNDCNYGNLDFEEELVENQIPYDKRWNNGDEYEGGEESFRIDAAGNNIVKEFYNSEIDVLQYSKVEEAAKEGIDAVKKLLKEFNEDRYIIPWEEQMINLSKLGA